MPAVGDGISQAQSPGLRGRSGCGARLPVRPTRCKAAQFINGDGVAAIQIAARGLFQSLRSRARAVYRTGARGRSAAHWGQPSRGWIPSRDIMSQLNRADLHWQLLARTRPPVSFANAATHLHCRAGETISQATPAFAGDTGTLLHCALQERGKCPRAPRALKWSTSSIRTSTPAIAPPLPAYRPSMDIKKAGLASGLEAGATSTGEFEIAPFSWKTEA